MKKMSAATALALLEPCTGLRLRVRVRSRDVGLGNPACATGVGAAARSEQASGRRSSALKAPAPKKTAKQVVRQDQGVVRQRRKVAVLTAN